MHIQFLGYTKLSGVIPNNIVRLDTLLEVKDILVLQDHWPCHTNCPSSCRRGEKPVLQPSKPCGPGVGAF